MKIKKFFFIILIVNFFSINISTANSNFFDEGRISFEKEDYEKSKFLFERDIVFNPKKYQSYLYLAKIYQKEDKVEYEEKNLNTVLLLDPKNEEALLMLAKIKIKESDFAASKELLEKFSNSCKKMCIEKK